MTGYVFKGLIKIWEIWINRWLSVLNLCSKAILCAKIAQKYKNSKRQKLLRSCRAQPWVHDRPIDGLHNISLQCGLSHRSLSCIPESGAKPFFISPYDIIFWPHELKDMHNIFFRAKRLDLQATKKKKTGNGQNFWIASLNAKLLQQSKNNKDILSFLLEMPSFLEKKRVSMPFSKALLISEKCRGRPGNRIDIDADNGWELWLTPITINSSLW